MMSPISLWVLDTESLLNAGAFNVRRTYRRPPGCVFTLHRTNPIDKQRDTPPPQIISSSPVAPGQTLAHAGQEIAVALDQPVELLEDERTYHPEALDTRGAILSLPPEERLEGDLANLPAYAQVWALGFMYAVESWPEDFEISPA